YEAAQTRLRMIAFVVFIMADVLNLLTVLRPRRSGHLVASYFAGATAPDGRTGAVAKFAGSSPVKFSRNATMSRVSASFRGTPSCTRAMAFTASGSVATDPSSTYGGVIGTLRRLAPRNPV